MLVKPVIGRQLLLLLLLCPVVVQDCQRYWTAGGTLRQLAPGAGRRKAKPAAGKPDQPEHREGHHREPQHKHSTREHQQTQSEEATPHLDHDESFALQHSPHDNWGPALDAGHTTAAAAAAAAAAGGDMLLSSGTGDMLSPGAGTNQLNPMQLPDGLIPNPLGNPAQGGQALAGVMQQQQQQLQLQQQAIVTSANSPRSYPGAAAAATHLQQQQVTLQHQQQVDRWSGQAMTP